MVKHLQMLHAILRTDTDIQRKQYTGVLYNRNIHYIPGNHTWVWDFSLTEWLDCSSLKKQILKTVRNKLLRKKTLNQLPTTSVIFQWILPFTIIKIWFLFSLQFSLWFYYSHHSPHNCGTVTTEKHETKRIHTCTLHWKHACQCH